MIREIINFTKDLIEDIPDIMEWKVQPNKGLHVFIDMDENGQWVNQNLQKGVDYDYYDGKSDLTQLLESTKIYNINSLLVNTDMNKCLDNDKCEYGEFIYPIKQIQTCSPYVVGFKRKEQEQDVELINGNKTKIKKQRFDVIVQRTKVYLSKASLVCSIDKKNGDTVKAFSDKINDIISAIKLLNITVGNKEIRVSDLSKNDFIMIYLRNISKDELERSYNKYLTTKLFLKNQYNSEENISDKTFGLPSYKIVDNEGKMFLKHLTGIQYMGINNRLSSANVKLLYKFTLLTNAGVLPNPLPIFIDKEEITGKLIKMFKEVDFLNYRYSEMINKIFEEKTELQKYYLLNRQGDNVVDFDFIPMFRYKIDLKIYNFTELKDKTIKIITNIFELERELSNLFVKYNNNSGQVFGFLIGNYFGNKIEGQKSFKGHTVTKETLSSFYKYRKSIYNYIYKSRQESITSVMFDDMVYSAILSDISMDEFKNDRHTNFYPIREKINIWFSLYNLFNNNLKENNMASKVPDLMSKMRTVAKGETNFETPEDFAFGAGQIVSYLIDRSVVANKTYSMLEPYLQKNRSNQLQDAIAQTIAIYKHDISVFKGKFERLAAQVLTDNSNVEMKPLLKYFLAGCFCPCVIYESDKNKQNNN